MGLESAGYFSLLSADRYTRVLTKHCPFALPGHPGLQEVLSFYQS